MPKTTTLLIAAAASASTLKLLSATQREGSPILETSARMAQHDLTALTDHVRATGADVRNTPLFSRLQGILPAETSDGLILA